MTKQPNAQKSTKIMTIVLVAVFSIGAVFGLANTFLGDSSSSQSAPQQHQYNQQAPMF